MSTNFPYEPYREDIDNNLEEAVNALSSGVDIFVEKIDEPDQVDEIQMLRDAVLESLADEDYEWCSDNLVELLQLLEMFYDDAEGDMARNLVDLIDALESCLSY